jgi:predicted MFS family arabinose efflux permease
VRLLQGGSFTSAFDRFLIGPLLLTIADDFQTSLAVAASVASVYFFSYGLGQPLWGLLSDRLGRVRTIRLSLALAAASALAAALSPSLPVLVASRAVTGMCMGAVVPLGVVYVGDAIRRSERHRILADLSAATALGLTAATVAGGLLAASVSWRGAFLLPCLMAGTLCFLLRRLPEPSRPAGAGGGLHRVLRLPWAWVVAGLGLLQGALLLGFLTYFAPAVESQGHPASVAGLVVGLYGVGMLATSRVVKRRSVRTRPSTFLAAGAAGLVVAFCLIAASRHLALVAASAMLVGSAWACLQPGMQSWVTEVAPQARAAMVSVFASMLFTGSGLLTAALAPLAGAGSWGPLFATGIVGAVMYGVLGPMLRARFSRGSSPWGGRAA